MVALAKICAIYQIVCLPTGERYVGSSEDVPRRWSTHRSQLKRRIHHSQLLQERWNCLGPEGFEFSILKLIDDEEHLIEAEREYLKTGDFIFNAAFPMKNPMKGRRHSPESIALMKKNRTGKPGRAKGSIFTEEHRSKLAAAAKGKKRPSSGRTLTSEQAKRMSELSRAGGKDPVRGKKLSEATCRKMSEAALRRDPSVYHRGADHPQFGKIAWNRGIPGPKGADSAVAKPIIVAGHSYPSITKASETLGVCVSTLYKWRKAGKAKLFPKRDTA